jgi:hypothetical protein
MKKSAMLVVVVFAIVSIGTGIYYLAEAQGGAVPIAIGLIGSVPVYFLIHDRIYALVKGADTEPSPVLATKDVRGRIWFMALLLSLFGCVAITFGSLSSEKAAVGTVEKKLLKKNKFGSPTSWRVVLDNGIYFYVSLSEGNALALGTNARVAYRDTFFGVRFITSHELNPTNQ